MSNAATLTLNEAGYVVEQSTTAINRAVDRGVIKATVQRRGKIRLRKVGPPELRFLAIMLTNVSPRECAGWKRSRRLSRIDPTRTRCCVEPIFQSMKSKR